MAAAGAHRPCPACLSDVPDGATFCPECGQRTRRRSRRGLGLVLGVAGAACVLAAIVVISRHDASREGTGGDFVPRDFVPGDTVPGDTVPGDTVPGDTVPGDTAPAGAVLALDPRFLGENRPPAPGQEAPRGKGGAEAGASLGKGARIAAESLVFLQTFGRGGRLRTETGALLLGGGVGVLPPGVLPGTYFARGWSPSGAYFRVSGVTGSDPETGLARVRVEGRDPGRPARLRIDPPGSEEPVYLLAPRVAGAPRVAVGSLRPIEGAPSGAWLRGGGGGPGAASRSSARPRRPGDGSRTPRGASSGSWLPGGRPPRRGS